MSQKPMHAMVAGIYAKAATGGNTKPRCRAGDAGVSEYVDDAWARQIARDAEEGKLDDLIGEAMREHREGGTRVVKVP